MNQEQICAIKIEEENCSVCSICSATCPFDAIQVDEEQNKLILDIEKCQVCGLCFSACPASAIELLYYEPDALLNYVVQQMKETTHKTVAVVCRGGSPPPSDKTREFWLNKAIRTTFCLEFHVLDVFRQNFI